MLAVIVIGGLLLTAGAFAADGGDDNAGFGASDVPTGNAGFPFRYTSGVVSNCYSDPAAATQKVVPAANMRVNVVNYGTITETVRLLNTTATDAITVDTTFPLGPGARREVSGFGNPSATPGVCRFALEVYVTSLNVVPTLRSAQADSDQVKLDPGSFQIYTDQGDGAQAFQQSVQTKRHKAWACPEGSTIANRFTLFIEILSPSAQTIRLTFFRSSGGPVVFDQPVNAAERKTVTVNGIPGMDGVDGVSTTGTGPLPFDLQGSMIAVINGDSSLAEITCNGL